MTKVILVNYTGGYCGNFLSHLIGEHLPVKYDISVNDDVNAYYFKSTEIETKYIKPFGKLFEIRNGFLSMKDLELITQEKIDPSYTYVMNLYKILHDEDDRVFMENVKSYYHELMSNLKEQFFLTNIHYVNRYKDLSIHDVFKDSSVVHISTYHKTYMSLFTLLFHAKTKNDAADQILQSKTLSDRSIFNDIVFPIPRPFDDRSIPVDMGKILFEDDYSSFYELQTRLSNEIGIELNLDLEKFKIYSKKNIEILEEILGKDFLEVPHVKLTKKILEYINDEIKVK